MMPDNPHRVDDAAPTAASASAARSGATPARVARASARATDASRRCVRRVAAVAALVAFAGSACAVGQSWLAYDGRLTSGEARGLFCDRSQGDALDVRVYVADTVPRSAVVVDLAGRAVVAFRAREAGGFAPVIDETAGALAFDATSQRVDFDLALGDACVVREGRVTLTGDAATIDPTTIADVLDEADRVAALVRAGDEHATGRWRDARRRAERALAEPGASRARRPWFAAGGLLLADIRHSEGDPGDRAWFARIAAAVDGAFEEGHAARLLARATDARYRVLEGSYDEAIAAREGIARTQRHRHVGADAATLDNDVRLATARVLAGQAPAALPELEALAPSVRRLLGAAHVTTMAAEVGLAMARDQAGRLPEAAAGIEVAYQAARARAGDDNPITARLLFDLAHFEMMRGRLHVARSASDRAAATFARGLGADNLHTINALERAAFVYSELARYDDAIALQRDVVARLVRRLGEDNPRTLGALANLASWLAITGRGDEALAIVPRVRDAYLARYGALHPASVSAAKQAAFAALDAGDVEGGCGALERIASSAELADPVYAESRGDATFGVGRCELERGRPAVALAVFRRYEAMVATGSEHAGERQLLWSAMGLAQLRSGARRDAIATLERLLAAIETDRVGEAPQSSGGRVHFARFVTGNRYLAGYRDLAALYADEGRVEDAIVTVERARARSIADTLALRLDASALPDRERVALARLDLALREIDAEFALSAPASVERSRIAVRREEIAGALARTQRRLAQRTTGPDEPRRELRKAIARLPRDTAYVGWQAHRGRYWAYVLRPGVAPALVRLSAPPSLEAEVVALRDALAGPAGRPLRTWRLRDGSYTRALIAPASDAEPVAIEALAGHVAEALLVPVATRLRGAKRLIIAADDALALVPFAVLPQGGAPLGSQIELVRVASLAVHDVLARRRPSPGIHDLVAVGAPDYASMRAVTDASPAPDDAGDRNTRTLGSSASIADPRPASSALQQRWAPLPAAAAEVRWIAALAPASRVRRFEGRNASKAQVLDANQRGLLAGTRWLHVAAHAFLSADAPQRSSIVLAGSDDAPAFLTAAELATFDIGAELVVLSACETALGRAVAGDGVFGLPYALTVAGARAALLTLWPVADQSTAEFMKRFYGKLARGARPSAALAATQREFMRHPRWRAPFYWAPFVLYGAG